MEEYFIFLKIQDGRRLSKIEFLHNFGSQITFWICKWIPFIRFDKKFHFSQNPRWPPAVKKVKNLRRVTFSIFSWNPTFNMFFLYEGGKSPADKFALKNAEFCLVSKTVKYVFVRIF